MAFHLGVYPAHSKRFSIALPVLTPRCRLPGASEEGKVKITLITAVLLAFGGGAHAGGRIQVFVNPNGAPLDVTGIAEGISSRMFAAAGVEVQWHMLRAGSRNAVPPGRAIIIHFENKAPAGLNPGTMAYALPFEGVHIVVYYDRIKSASRDNPALRATILGHVLTHEITHI